jgi:hypothetical protein
MSMSFDEHQKFIQYRGEGKSYAWIANELGRSKTQLLSLGKQYKNQIENLRNCEMEALLEQNLGLKRQRILEAGKLVKVLLPETKDIEKLGLKDKLKLLPKYLAILKSEDFNFEPSILDEPEVIEENPEAEVENDLAIKPLESPTKAEEFELDEYQSKFL